LENKHRLDIWCFPTSAQTQQQAEEAMDAGNSKESEVVAELKGLCQEVQALHQTLAHIKQAYSTSAASGVYLTVCTSDA